MRSKKRRPKRPDRFHTLKQTNEAKEKVITQKVDELNTAYYTLGTEKELIANKVMTKSGGFIGIGRNKKVQQDFNREYFKKIDITKTTSFTNKTALCFSVILCGKTTF